jgi:Acyl-CoA oxidase
MQTARFALKGALGLATGQIKPDQAPASLAYLLAASSDRRPVGADGWLRAAFARRGCWLVETAINDLVQHPESRGKPQFSGAPWNDSTLALIAAARGYCHCYMLSTFEASVDAATRDGKIGHQEAAVLARCGELWAVELMVANLGEFIMCGAVQADEVRTCKRTICDVHELYKTPCHRPQAGGETPWSDATYFEADERSAGDANLGTTRFNSCVHACRAPRWCSASGGCSASYAPTPSRS